ncbi:MAG TPA: hypothetical protein VKN76_06090, partial [Kiloniellaceae bacterium]|nr:hypothetical protein [Kiloniellaceae bacterium]
NGTARKSKSAIQALRNLDWEMVGSGDYDGSGTADLLWRHQGKGGNQIWLLDGFTILDRGKIPKFGDTQWQVQR